MLAVTLVVSWRPLGPENPLKRWLTRRADGLGWLLRGGLRSSPWACACEVASGMSSLWPSGSEPNRLLTHGVPQKSRLPRSAPGDLPDPGVEPLSLTSPELTGRFFTTSATQQAQPFSKGDLSVPTWQLESLQIDGLEGARQKLYNLTSRVTHHSVCFISFLWNVLAYSSWEGAVQPPEPKKEGHWELSWDLAAQIHFLRLPRISSLRGGDGVDSQLWHHSLQTGIKKRALSIRTFRIAEGLW